MLELSSEKGITTPLVRLGWPDKFIEHATTVDTLRERHGLTAAALVARIKETLAGTAVKALPVAATA